MAGKIFINYRRDDSIGMAGRLHDRFVQTFGRSSGMAMRAGFHLMDWSEYRCPNPLDAVAHLRTASGPKLH